jgi:hypothetical protein
MANFLKNLDNREREEKGKRKGRKRDRKKAEPS